jgi:Fe2+ transport system protein FeoA
VFLDEAQENVALRLLSLEGEAWLTGRLQELGFIPGQRLELQMRLISGEPLIVRMAGSRFALRQNEARCLRVTEDVNE